MQPAWRGCTMTWRWRAWGAFACTALGFPSAWRCCWAGWGRCWLRPPSRTRSTPCTRRRACAPTPTLPWTTPSTRLCATSRSACCGPRGTGSATCCPAPLPWGPGTCALSCPPCWALSLACCLRGAMWMQRGRRPAARRCGGHWTLQARALPLRPSLPPSAAWPCPRPCTLLGARPCALSWCAASPRSTPLTPMPLWSCTCSWGTAQGAPSAAPWRSSATTW